MIHRTMSLSMTHGLKEIARPGAEGFPHAALEADLSLYPGGYSPWHWHEQFEFCAVERGAARLDTQRGGFTLRAGEGYFVNANVLHANRALDGPEPARLRVHQFGAALIGGGELALRRYVRPIETCAALDALAVSPNDAAGRELLDALNSAFRAAGEEPPGFELRIAECLTRAWRCLSALAEPILRGANPRPRDDASRIKRMLSCIHARYAEPLTVADIARAAGVGERECYRCFQSALGTSPTAYLTRQRVDAAARLLSSTSRSVTEIALDCGFASPGYFCSVFHRVMGETPSDYRRGSSARGQS